MSLEQITSQTLIPYGMLDKNLDVCLEDVAWQERADYMRVVLRTVADGSKTMTAPEIYDALGGILRKRFGIVRGVKRPLC